MALRRAAPPAAAPRRARQARALSEPRFGLGAAVADAAVRRRAADHFRAAGVALPTLAQLADPSTIPRDVATRLAGVDPDAADPLNLFRVHWHNAADRRGVVAVPQYLRLTPELTGVEATILVAVGQRFPMIHAHKVLAAYGCLAPRVAAGQFDPTRHRAIWPSTGNYCRGGVAISRILRCRSAAVLPEGMSRERFEWLERWVSDPADVIRTFGCESNVKEIYDACGALERDAENFLFNQFCDFGNYVTHYHVTGPALRKVHAADAAASGRATALRAFVSATGSGGTIAAGDYLKQHEGAKIVAVESAECPTMLYNGFGEHGIQGIGDKHVPFIHNVMNTDMVVGVSDRDTDGLGALFTSAAGREYLTRRRGVPAELVAALPLLGFSGICNVLAAVRACQHYGWGRDDAVVTVATDASAMYRSDIDRVLARRFGGAFDAVDAAEVYGKAVLGAAAAPALELREEDRRRVFNLGYYTWVEQQGVSVADFEARRSQRWWEGIRGRAREWDAMIDEFNAEVAAPAAPRPSCGVVLRFDAAAAAGRGAVAAAA